MLELLAQRLAHFLLCQCKIDQQRFALEEQMQHRSSSYPGGLDEHQLSPRSLCLSAPSNTPKTHKPHSMFPYQQIHISGTALFSNIQYSAASVQRSFHSFVRTVGAH